MIKSYSLIILTCLFLLASCQKNSDVFVPDTGQQLDSAWVTNIQANAQVVQLSNKISGIFTSERVSVAADATIRTNTGFTIEIPKGALLLSGTEYADSVRVEFVFVQRKGDFIRFGVPTISNQYPLESGGAFFIRFLTTPNSTMLTVNPAKRIYIKYVDEMAKQGMNLFYTTNFPSPASTINWLTTNDASTVNLWSTSTTPIQKGYVVATARTGWLSVDKHFETGLATTDVKVVMPDLFSNANTAVFMVFKSVRSVVQMNGNNTMRAFSFTNIPVNYEVKFVAISKVADSYYLGVKDEKITANHSTFIRPELSSLEKIQQFLFSL
ncbi:MAG: hypothetical protein KGZ74_14805 [Chitinophagaceae bacterium]|nr:hypothetical protein [Chitinophagaceae bacterium]